MISKTAIIVNSDIGKNPHIYENTRIKDSNLGDNVIIGDLAIIENSNIEGYNSINRSNYVLKSKIGRFTYTGIGSSIRTTTVGRFCSMAWGVSLGGGNHEFSHITTSPRWRFNMLYNGALDHISNNDLQSRYNKFGKCTIGNDVWIATNAIVLRNLTIGNGAIIGAGAVVTKDVEPYAVVAGVPAKKIKMRFDDKTIEALEELQWWNWPVEIIRENLDLIYSSKVNKQIIEQLKEIKSKIR